jgi:hypothetical protein
MTQRCRLLVRAHMNDALCEPGHEFELPDGVLGPHRSIVQHHERIDIRNDAARILPNHENEPLYEIWNGEAWIKPTQGAK